ncbi:MAG: glutathione S-transferase [Polyangiaceae bacterium]|nr:glutathione S-transferase [Polyangiaceae bacterium]
MQNPILYSFRRCPYAIRARLALRVAGIAYELREVSLKNKPPELFAASQKGTVPVLVLPDGGVIDESLDIMHWALAANDPAGWLSLPGGQRSVMDSLIAENDGPFKRDLDRFKYPHRYEGVDANVHRDAGVAFLHTLEARLNEHAHLLHREPSLADYAIVPFVRQFAAHQPDWFATLPMPKLHGWLAALVSSPLFAEVMSKT